MPEQPEIAAHAERMSAALAGATLSGFRLLNIAGLKTFSPPPDDAVGATVESVGQRGKYLLIRFSNHQTHIVHLMQGGRIRPDPKRSKKPRNGIARWTFEANGEEAAWLLTEAGTERRAGVWVVEGDVEATEPLSSLGPEAATIDRATLASVLAEHSGRVHGLLRDQRQLAGIGRMLANEILFEASLSPFASAKKLTGDQVDSLHTAIGNRTAAALGYERTLDDIGRSKDRPSLVHNRAGEPCVDSCGASIAAVEYRAYTVYYCPQRQTGGKILADNTTSKFLK